MNAGVFNLNVNNAPSNRNTNKEILITDYQLRTSHFKEDSYIIIQFHDEGGFKVIFTAASVIRKQIERHKDRIPFYGTIVKKNKYYTLS